MIDIFVIRGSGERQGDDVVNGLIGSLPVALALGRSKLDENAQQMRDDTLESVYRDGIRLGHTARINDQVRGSLAEKITGISHRAQGGRIDTSLNLRRAAT